MKELAEEMINEARILDVGKVSIKVKLFRN